MLEAENTNVLVPVNGAICAWYKANNTIDINKNKEASGKRLYFGAKDNMNFRCLHPARHVLRWGFRLGGSFLSVVGISDILSSIRLALITISDANSMPVQLNLKF